MLSENMMAIRQFIRKCEFWFLMAFAAGLNIAHEIRGNVTLPSILI